VIDTESTVNAALNDIRTRLIRENGRIVVQRTQDVEPYLERNKRLRNDFQRRRNTHMRYVAEIPNVVIEQWLREGINVFDPNHAKAVQRKLNSNEFHYLRTSPGRMAVRV
jgi:hypothetical protein